MRALEGVDKVEIDAVRMELVVSHDGSRNAVERIIEAVRSAGYDARRK